MPSQLIAALLSDLKIVSAINVTSPSVQNDTLSAQVNTKHTHKRTNSGSQFISLFLPNPKSVSSISVNSLSSSNTQLNGELSFKPEDYPSPDSLQIIEKFLNSHRLTSVATSIGSVSQSGSADKLISELLRIFKEKVPNQISSPHVDSSLIADYRLYVFAKYLELLLPCFEPTKFLAANWWREILEPALLYSRWSPLVDVCAKIVKGIMTGEHFAPILGSSYHIKFDFDHVPTTPSSVSSVLEFRNTVISTYLSERIDVWRLPNGKSLTSNDAIFPTSSPFWETIGESNLERLEKFRSEFFALVSNFCGKQEYRLQTLILICQLIRREDSQTFYIIETPLFDILLKCVTIDTHPAVICTAITVLILVLPHCYTRLGNGDTIERLLHAFLRSILWCIDYEKIISRIDVENIVTEKSQAEALLVAYSKNISTESVEYFFAYLYGMFPCLTIRFLRDFINSEGKEFFPIVKNFPVVNDPFESLRNRIFNENEKSTSKHRILSLLQKYKLHQNLVLLDPERERLCKHFEGKEPFEIAIDCLSQRVGFDKIINPPDEISLTISSAPMLVNSTHSLSNETPRIKLSYEKSSLESNDLRLILPQSSKPIDIIKTQSDGI
ncbi:hypothetical protein HK096_001555 [Nowakowskiella sp. JEL0078]|nr:hypothetical protein HK096_001555 [Nowakowskiella sp. JEL0078]